RQEDRMPVADLAERLGVHVGAGLARVKQRNEHDKEHHVAGQRAEDKGTGAIKKLTRFVARIPPVVVAASATAPGGPAVDGRFAPGARRFTFRFRGDGREKGRHREPREDEITPPLALTHPKAEEWAGRSD